MIPRTRECWSSKAQAESSKAQAERLKSKTFKGTRRKCKSKHKTEQAESSKAQAERISELS